MTALYWVRSDKSKTWIPRECGVCEYGFRDLLTGTIWSLGRPVADGHPDERIDAMFRAAYRQPAPVLEEIVPRRRRGIMALFRGDRA
ncbi:MAG: hypothetical protein IPO40_24870 [Fibrobacteres bacterium]|nr:hypothetical protein [Fibrobacterota bacterium]